MSSPGFTALLRHELRLWWRSYARKDAQPLPMKRLIVGALVFLLVIHGIAAGTLHMVHLPVEASAANLVRLTAIICLLWCWMLSQALNTLTQAVFSRGDADLLMSSPVSMRKVLAIRALALTIPVIFSSGFILLPMAHIMAIRDGIHWLLAYPVMGAIGLAATASGLLLIMGLFRLIGPAHTRTLAQILAIIVSAAAFITFEARALLPDSWLNRFDAIIARISAPDHFNHDALQWLPAQAMFGDIRALLSLCASALVLFAAAVWLFAGGDALQQAAAAATLTRARPRAVTHRSRAFRPGVTANLLRKEWLLILRDPWLLSQILLQVVYIVPMGIVFWRSTVFSGPSTAGLAPMLVMLSGQMAGGLAWITLSGEDAPDLVASAPVPHTTIRRAKILAALVPVVLIMAFPVLALTLQSAWLGLLTLLASLGSALTAIIANLWMQKPLPRRTFAYRQRGSIVGNLTELALNFFWFFIAAALIWRSFWGLLAVALLAGLMASIRPRDGQAYALP